METGEGRGWERTLGYRLILWSEGYLISWNKILCSFDICWQANVFFNNWNFTKEISPSVQESWKLWLPWIWDCKNLTPWGTGFGAEAKPGRKTPETSELTGKEASLLPTWFFSLFFFFHNLFSLSFFNLCILVKHPINPACCPLECNLRKAEQNICVLFTAVLPVPTTVPSTQYTHNIYL